uniref:Uncharacterized protein n=1 Tax=Triticum urartu TaxID=4572 RepID=A0A8R7U0R4_TRIUA
MIQRNCTSAADQVASAGKGDGDEEAAAPPPRRRRRRRRGRPSDRFGQEVRGCYTAPDRRQGPYSAGLQANRNLCRALVLLCVLSVFRRI